MKATTVSGTSRRTVETAAPTPRFWRWRAVCSFAGISKATLERRIKAGDFPQPVKLGPNTIAWPADEVEAWAAAKIAERDRVAA